jgi:hypothetical protein
MYVHPQLLGGYLSDDPRRSLDPTRSVDAQCLWKVRGRTATLKDEA